MKDETFLSTLSLRRATNIPIFGRYYWIISIHALLAESDRGIKGYHSIGLHFYPRSPCGERLENPLRQVVNRRISIHALLAESDNKARFMQTALEHFYPRSPCGERRRFSSVIFSAYVFLSTLSLRRATYNCTGLRGKRQNFYPRSPCGERPVLHNTSLPAF